VIDANLPIKRRTNWGKSPCEFLSVAQTAMSLALTIFVTIISGFNLGATGGDELNQIDKNVSVADLARR
jgi:hypothetical protein